MQAAARIRKRAVTQLWCLACGTRATARWKYVHADDALSTFGRLVLCRTCAHTLDTVRTRGEAHARTHVHVLEAVLACSLLKQRRCSLATKRGRSAAGMGLQLDERGQPAARPLVRARDCSEDAAGASMDAHFDFDVVLELAEPRTNEWAHAAALVDGDLVTPYASVGAHIAKRRRTDAEGGLLERLAAAAASPHIDRALGAARCAAASALLDSWLATARDTGHANANANTGADDALGALLEDDARYAAFRRYGAAASAASTMCARAPHALVSTRRVAASFSDAGAENDEGDGDDAHLDPIEHELALLAAARPLSTLVLSPRATWFEAAGAPHSVTLHEALVLPDGARPLDAVLGADATRRSRCSTLRAFVQFRAYIAPHNLEFAASDFASVRHGLYVVARPDASPVFCATHCVLRRTQAAAHHMFTRDVYALAAELLFDGDAHALEHAAATHPDAALRAWLAFAFGPHAPVARPHADFFAHHFFAHLNSPFCVE